MISDVLLYMDKNFIKLHRKLSSYTLSLKIFRDVVVYHPDVRERLRMSLIENITKERDGNVIDRHLIKTVVTMLRDVSIDNASGDSNNSTYEEEFEAYFLDATAEYYREESLLFLAQVIIFMAKCITFLYYLM